MLQTQKSNYRDVDTATKDLNQELIRTLGTFNEITTQRRGTSALEDIKIDT